MSLPPQTPRVRAGDRVYGRVARQGSEVWLQYWFIYASNPQDRGLLATGRHEGDWELFQLRLGPGDQPDLATLSQHSWSEGCEYERLGLAGGRRARFATLYIANGSHAIYSAPGLHDRPFPDPNDEADGRGRRTRPELRAVDDDAPGWVAYEGKWGASRAGIVPGESSSPVGPMFQGHGAWRAPSSFHADTAVGCGSGPPGAWWQWAGWATLAAVTLGALLWLRRSRARAGRPQASA